jgi:hypothetical protein
MCFFTGAQIPASVNLMESVDKSRTDSARPAIDIHEHERPEQETKGTGSRIATLTMVFKLVMEAQKHWRRINGRQLVAKVVTGVKFVDGEEQIEQAA